MRQLTTLEINRIKLLTEKSVELCLIEPTGTGLEKSIMDATGSVRTSRLYIAQILKKETHASGLKV
jgi:hypothetical protein